MPGQSGSEVRIKDRVVRTFWSPEEHNRLADIAAFNDCSRAEVLRRLVDDAAAKIVATRDLSEHVRALGKRLNDVARRINAKAPVRHADVRELYEEMLDLLDGIRS